MFCFLGVKTVLGLPKVNYICGIIQNKQSSTLHKNTPKTYLCDSNVWEFLNVHRQQQNIVGMVILSIIPECYITIFWLSLDIWMQMEKHGPYFWHQSDEISFLQA